MKLGILLLIIGVCLLIGYSFGAWIEKGTKPDNHTNTRDDLPMDER